MAFKSSAAYLAMAAFVGIVACIGAAIVYFMHKGEKEVATEVQRAAQVRNIRKKSQYTQDNQSDDDQSLQAPPQVERQRGARPVNRAQAGVRRRQRAAAAEQQLQQQQQEEQQAAASDESGGSEVAFTCSWSTHLLLHASYAFVVQ